MALSKGAIVTGVGLTALAGLLGGLAIAKSHRKKSSKRKSRNKNSRKKNNHNHKRGRYTPHTAGKGKDRSKKRIRYTSNGQPYIIIKGGKARFIKKSSAKRSHKQQGGKY